MSKYFAKYLPVEGEIKNGDCYIDTKAKIPGTIYRLYPEGIDFPLSEMKKAQLFLCSRDIQVGDTFQSVKYPGKVFIARPAPELRVNGAVPMDCYYTKEDNIIQWVPEWEAFKVIGPISPEAAWVKEGDEFEEDQVDYSWTTSLDNHTKPFVRIKSPCGHFH